MKKFEFVSPKGMSVEVVISEKLDFDEVTDTYDLQITDLKIDGIEVPKRTESGRLFVAEIGHVYREGKRILVISLKYDSLEFVKKLKNLPAKLEIANIACSDEIVDYYEKVFKPKVENLKKQRKAEKERRIQRAFEALIDDTVLEITNHTSYGFSVDNEAGEHEWFKTAFIDIEKAKIELPQEFLKDVDIGDYSITQYYKIPFGELKKVHEEARRILTPIEEKAAREKAEREAKLADLKAAVKCEIIKKGKTKGEALDPYVIVKMTCTKTGNTLEFICRNIFDVGYVINPHYEVAEGLGVGGLQHKNKWQTFDNEKGWYDVRELTEFEKQCLEYLRLFPPVSSDIRM